MKARPILFSKPMVQALLAGTKSQTRRLITWGGIDACRSIRAEREAGVWRLSLADGDVIIHNACPYGKSGDILWVRESCHAIAPEDGVCSVEYDADGTVIPIENTQDAADAWFDLWTYRKKQGARVMSIHMPRWASRITLEVTRVRAERLHDISEEDAAAEGLWRLPSGQWTAGLGVSGDYARDVYADLWTTINGPESWNENPWVWAVDFRVLKINVDQHMEMA